MAENRLNQTAVTKSIKRAGKTPKPGEISGKVAVARVYGKRQELVSERATRVLGKPSSRTETKVRTGINKEAVRSRRRISSRMFGKPTSPNLRFAKLGALARNLGKLGIAGMAFGAYSTAKDFQSAKKPKRQEM